MPPARPRPEPRLPWGTGFVSRAATNPLHNRYISATAAVPAGEAAADPGLALEACRFVQTRPTRSRLAGAIATKTPRGLFGRYNCATFPLLSGCSAEECGPLDRYLGLSAHSTLFVITCARVEKAGN